MKEIISCLFLYFVLSTCYGQTQESVCYGTTKNGRLTDGVKLPNSGVNFTSYGFFPELIGRTYVHSIVKEVVIESYQQLEVLRPKTKYKYAETGFKNGGKFKPHKTHQNGLSIDFMVPVLDKNNESVYFSTTALNKYGYNVEFDSNGVNEQYRIDFDALAEHLVILNKTALKYNIGLWRVIFSPDLQDKLYVTKHGRYIKEHIYIPKTKSWVRHDEHYHVDFSINCIK